MVPSFCLPSLQVMFALTLTKNLPKTYFVKGTVEYRKGLKHFLWTFCNFFQAIYICLRLLSMKTITMTLSATRVCLIKPIGLTKTIPWASSSGFCPFISIVLLLSFYSLTETCWMLSRFLSYKVTGDKFCNKLVILKTKTYWFSLCVSFDVSTSCGLAFASPYLVKKSTNIVTMWFPFAGSLSWHIKI